MARYFRAVALVVLAFVAGALLNPFTSSATAREQEAVVESQPAWVPTTSTTVTGADVAASARTEEGAIEAAGAFVCTGQQLIDMSDDEIAAFLREVATTADADRIVEDHLEAIASLREALASGVGPIVYRQAVVAHRVEAFDEDAARVAIWHVGVLARSEVAPPQAGWMISTVDLRWERGGWKVAGEIAVPGPAPILNDGAPPATADELVDVLDGFTDFRGAA
jgi:hypothetical protein